MVVSSNKGRVYRPKNSERLILHFKNLNHVKPDKWGTIHLAAFIQQVRIKQIRYKIVYINCVHKKLIILLSENKCFS